jgi:hypothetical protein
MILFNKLKTKKFLQMVLMNNGFLPIQLANVRNQSNLPINFGIMFVPQQEAWVVERMGKFNKILSPVIIIKIPQSFTELLCFKYNY